MKAVLLCIALALSSVAVLASEAAPKVTTTKSGKAAAAAEKEARGTENLPLVVEIKAVPEPSKEMEAEQAAERREHSKLETWLVLLTGALAIATALLWVSTARLVKGADKTAAKQLRAYLTVSVGSGIYQERDKQLRFELKPTLHNSGRTPAHDMSYWARAAVLPFPLPEDFAFSIPENQPLSSMIIGPQQGIELNAMVENYVPDDEVAAIKAGTNRRVHIWGIVTYTDAFDEVHTTKFCHSLRWFAVGENEHTTGTYSFRHNEAT